MAKLIVLSAAEQVAAHLRGELLAGKWSGLMPGGDRLAAELGAGRDTIEAALKQLEREGLLENQGRRRGRRILQQVEMAKPRGLRVSVLLFEKEDRGADFIIRAEYRLTQEGHDVVYAPQSLMDVEMSVERVARLVERTEADAWLVLAGSKEVLEWFAGQGIPVMAVFGRRRSVPVAGVGPDKIPAVREATRALLARGHQRIVFLTRSLNRLPEPAAAVRAFSEELANHGIVASSYHLPEWEESVPGLHARLKSLFHLTPPTAMLIDEAPFFVAVRHFLGNLRLAVPEDVSLVCMDDDPAFAWCAQEISHIRWDRDLLARRISQWVSNVSQGRKDIRQTFTPAVFAAGETIGPARK